jgi:hypothetical protein
LLSNDGSRFVFENNILNRSEFPENKDKDITDKLILASAPAVDFQDTTYILAVDETSIDRSYFDNFRFFAIDHPQEKELAVTNEGRIVLIDPSGVISPAYAEHDSYDVTEILQFDKGGKSITGKSQSSLLSKFDVSGIRNDSFAVILDAAPDPDPVIPVVKDAAGILTVYDDSGIPIVVPLNLAIRQKRSMVTIQLPALRSLSFADMCWKKEFDISYFALAPIVSGGFTLQELELKRADDILNGDITQMLRHEDNIHAVLDSSTSFILRFNAELKSISPGMKRSFLLSATGRYSKPSGFIALNSSEVIRLRTDDESVLHETALLPNVPNPFNPITTVRFYLKSDEEVDLSVFDVSGRFVSRIAGGQLGKGNHQYSFDGSSLSSGAYYLKLSTKSKTEVRKMLLIK